MVQVTSHSHSQNSDTTMWSFGLKESKCCIFTVSKDPLLLLHSGCFCCFVRITFHLLGTTWQIHAIRQFNLDTVWTQVIACCSELTLSNGGWNINTFYFNCSIQGAESRIQEGLRSIPTKEKHEEIKHFCGRMLFQYRKFHQNEGTCLWRSSIIQVMVGIIGSW